MAYTNKGKIQNFLAIDIDTSLDSQITEWIAVAKRYIDNYVGKTFEQVTAETRYFDGNGLREIIIDDVISITSVQILEVNSSSVQFTLTEGQDNDFITYPYNTTSKYQLILTPSSQVASWSGGTKRIKITANWGHSATVPEDITLAATILVAGIIEKGLKGGTVQSESLGDYSVSFKVMDDISNVMSVKDILNRYKIYKL